MSIPKLSKLEADILQLLVSHTKLYGLQMIQLDPAIKRGSIYVTLNRMEEKGFVESSEVKHENVSGLPRRIYTPTGLGRRVFALSQSFALESLEGLVHA